MKYASAASACILPAYHTAPDHDACMQWCVQVLPECGSFKTTVQSALFPAIKKIKQSEDAGQPKSVAIAAAIPTLVRAFARSLGCREMCQALVDTCSCNIPGESVTFGQALTDAEDNLSVQQVRSSLQLQPVQLDASTRAQT